MNTENNDKQKPTQCKPKPPWLRISYKHGSQFPVIKNILKKHRLHTVCEEAQCPNIHECYSAGTATFLIMGDICTRNCRFCGVKTGTPEPLDPEEPERIAEATAEMGLKHVVLTSVDRDDLPDEGAGHFSATVRAIRQRSPSCRIEVLTPDFHNRKELLDSVFQSRPDIFGFNMETVESLHAPIRPAVSYEVSLSVLRYAAACRKQYGFMVKSGFMVGLGETEEDIRKLIADLAAVPCDMITIGQYLAPSQSHTPVKRIATPQEFLSWKQTAEKLGIAHAFSGPLVRSSYHAAEQV